MWLRREWVAVFVLMNGSACASDKAATPKNSKTISIKTGSDDGYTSRLVDAVQAELSRDEELSYTNSFDSDFVLDIPDAVRWQKVTRRIKLSYRFVLTDRRGKKSYNLTGICWETKLKMCADDIIGRIHIAIE